MNLVFNKNLFKYSIFFSTLFLFIYLTPTFAANPSAPFSPSANVVDPNCLPTDSNCYVSMSNMTFTNATTTNLAVSGNLGIGTSTSRAKLNIDLISTSTTAGNLYAGHTKVSDTGVVTSGTDLTYGSYIDFSRTGATGGFIYGYGSVINAIADNAGAGVSHLFGESINTSGADYNIGLSLSVDGNGIGGTIIGTERIIGDNTFASGDIYAQKENIRADGVTGSAYGLYRYLQENSYSTTANNIIGSYQEIYDGADVSSGTDNTYGDYIQIYHDGFAGGTFNTYGSYINVAGGTAGTGTVYGVYADVSSGDFNYPGIFMGGNVGIGVTTPGEKLEVAGNIISKGISWTSRTSAADNQWKSVTYGNGLFVAVASSGTGNRVMTSPDGITWTSRTSAADNNWSSVTYGNGLFVAVAYSGIGNRVMTSPDGITWTSRTSAADNWWYSVTYGNGLFVAVAASGIGNRVMTSPDGITWTSRTSAADNQWESVTYGNGLFVAVASTGTGNRVMTSPDGITWTSRTSAADNNWSSVTYGNGLFVAVAYTGTGNRVMTSPDGITWTSRTSAADNDWYSVTYGNGLFVAVEGSGAGNQMTSPDGITWTSRMSATNNVWTSAAYGNGMFVAVAMSGTSNRVMTSGKPDYIPFSADNTYQGGMKIFGNVSIGTSTSPYALAVGNSTISGVVSRFQNSTGYCDINPTTTSLTCTSDERLKKNILDIGSTTLDKLTKLRPVTYNWLSESSTSSPHAGLIAQEVESLFPDLVSTDDSGTKSVAYGGFIPYILEGMKSIMATITSFKDSFTTNTLCVGTLTDRTCVTKNQLDALLQNANQSSTYQPPLSSTTSVTTNETASSTLDTTIPVIVAPIDSTSSTTENTNATTTP